MNKIEFLSRLQTYLTFMDIVERDQTLEFYAEQIDDRIDDGMTELQAVASLEAPEDIAVNLERMRLNVDVLSSYPHPHNTSPTPVTAVQNSSAPQSTSSFQSSPVFKWAIIIFALVITSPLWLLLLSAGAGIGVGIFSIIIAVIGASFGVAVGAVAVLISSVTQIFVQNDGLSQLAYGGSFLASLGVLLLAIVVIYVFVRFIAFIFTTGARGISHAIDRWRAARKRRKHERASAVQPIHSQMVQTNNPVPPTPPISSPNLSVSAEYDRTGAKSHALTAQISAPSMSSTPSANGDNSLHTTILKQPLMVVSPGAAPQLIDQARSAVNSQEVRHD